MNTKSIKIRLKHWKPVLKMLLASSLLLSTTSCNELVGFFAPLFGGDENALESSLNDGEAFQAPIPEVTLEKGQDQSGTVDTQNDMQIVSAEYLVQLKTPEAGDTAVIKIPLSKIPQDLSSDQIQVERYDATQAQWVSSGNLSWYDSGTQTVWFRDRLPVTVTPATEFSTEQVQSKAVKYRISVYIFSNDKTAQREGSHFRIHYYPSHLANKNKIKSDAEWNSPNGSNAADVPDFVEDLDTALTQAYEALLKVKHSEGLVFKALDVQDVYISDTGGNAGDSKLGGPLRISNKQIANYDDLKLTAAHELVHVFQGQYYTMQGLFTGRYNHWFIEAVANYYAARVNNLDSVGKKAFYGEFFADYLSVSLTSSLDNSMYAAGHFLDWLSQKYSLNLVGDALRLSIGNDMVGLSKAISLNSNSASSIGGAFEDYVQEILTQPEDEAGFNLAIRSSMEQHSFGYGYLSTTMFNNTRTYARIQKVLPPLSAAMVSLNIAAYQNRYNKNLLVMVNNANKGSLLHGATYLMESDFNKDYLTARPIDKYLNHAGFKEHHAFTNFETFSQMMYNNSPASKATIDMSYYVLRPPAMEQISGDDYSINVKKTVGNIPLKYLSGFKVYDNKGKLLKGPVAVESSVEQQVIPLQIGVKAAFYTISDKVGNEWPYYIVLSDNNDTQNKPGQTVRLEAKLIGFEDADLKWEAQYPGALSASGSSASYRTSAQDNTYDTIKVTSSKYPHLYAQTTIATIIDTGGCVAAGTVVTLADGSRKAIETLKAGEAIQAWDEDSNTVVPAQIRQVLIHHDATYTLNRVQGGDGDEIQITGNHPVYTKESGWIPVAELTPGMTLYQLDHVSKSFVPTVVKGIIREESTSKVVYNLLTSEGNYFANDLLIHNKCLAAGSLIDSPNGLLTVETLKPGDLVYSATGQETTVSKVFRKETIRPTLRGKVLPNGGAVTNNHRIYWQGQWQEAGQTDLKETSISGPVYDLETEVGTYRSGAVMMGKNY